MSHGAYRDLAEQHARGISRMLDPLGIEVTLLTGSLNVRSRREALNLFRMGRRGCCRNARSYPGSCGIR